MALRSSARVAEEQHHHQVPETSGAGAQKKGRLRMNLLCCLVSAIANLPDSFCSYLAEAGQGTVMMISEVTNWLGTVGTTWYSLTLPLINQSFTAILVTSK